MDRSDWRRRLSSEWCLGSRQGSSKKGIMWSDFDGHDGMTHASVSRPIIACMRRPMGSGGDFDSDWPLVRDASDGNYYI